MFLSSFQACKFSSKLWKIKSLHGLTFRLEQKLWVQGSLFLFLFFGIFIHDFKKTFIHSLDEIYYSSIVVVEHENVWVDNI
jgi:hypothetical protein